MKGGGFKTFKIAKRPRFIEENQGSKPIGNADFKVD